MRISTKRAVLAAPLLCALFATSSVLAQGFARVAMTPLAVDPAPGVSIDAPQPRGSYGLSSSEGPTGIAERYWYWNRDALLPRPEPRPPGTAIRPGAGEHTSAARGEFDWLLLMARAADADQRAHAIYAIGCAGPGGGGYVAIEAALQDDESIVRQSALLALGEHAGTAARFRLVREMADVDRSREHRCTAALAFGMACAVDGGAGGRVLRRFVSGAPVPDSAAAATWLEAGCAADALSGGHALAALATDWLVDHVDKTDHCIPALAVANAIADVPRAFVVARLQKLFGSSHRDVSLAARMSALQAGSISATMRKDWLTKGNVDHRALFVFASLGQVDFPALAQKGFQSSSLRGVYALGLALHARQVDYPEARTELVTASRKQRSFHERPLWLLATAIAGDPAASPRARALLMEPRTPDGLRLAAADVLALDRVGDRTFLRRAVHLDPAVSVRLRAADGISRHGAGEDVHTIVWAVEHTALDGERAALLVALGRTRHRSAAVTLQRWCTDLAAPGVVREGAWLGLALNLRHSPEAPLARLPRGTAFGYLPAWLLQLADSQR